MQVFETTSSSASALRSSEARPVLVVLRKKDYAHKKNIRWGYKTHKGNDIFSALWNLRQVCFFFLSYPLQAIQIPKQDERPNKIDS